MESTRFDALTRAIATTSSRRQIIRTLGGGVAAVLGGLGRTRFTDAATCASGVVCAARCCPDASDICVAGRCTSCPSGVICGARCCAEGESCVDGRCQGALTSPGPGPCVPTCTSTSSCLDSNGCGGVCGCPSGQACDCGGQCGPIQTNVQCV